MSKRIAPLVVMTRCLKTFLQALLDDGPVVEGWDLGVRCSVNYDTKHDSLRSSCNKLSARNC